MANKLYLFTGQYPYSQYVECFLEDEIQYLAKCFSEIIIVPTRGASTKREIPENCEVMDPVFPKLPLFIIRGMYNKRTFCLLMKDFLSNKVYASRAKMGVWIKAVLVINNLLNSKVVKEIEKKIDSSDVLYYYWGKWSNLLTLFIDKKCKHVSRFHGAWDLWEEEYDNYAPLRYELSKKLDKAVFISRKGEDYFKKKYPATSTTLSPLGSLDCGTMPLKADKEIHFVSCSTVYPLKRVELIYQSVARYAQNNPNKTIKWTHMGGGVGFENLKELINNTKPGNLKVKLMGNLEHSQVISCYQTTHFDVFINLSTNEGVPVSIMEALSFDIPVVATSVGGTPEIVTEMSGKLVAPIPTVEEVVKALQEVLSKKIYAREFWSAHYSADINYSEFADLLKKISLYGKDTKC